MSIAAIGAGLARGAEKAFDKNFTDDSLARRSKARLQKEQADQALQIAQASKAQNVDIASQELQLVQQQNAQLINDNNKRATYDGFDRYLGDNDVRHLNVMLDTVKSNKVGQKLFGPIIRMDSISPADLELVARDLGTDEARLLANEDDTTDIQNDIVKITKSDGTVKAARLSELMAMTGYTNYANKQELARQKELATIRRLNRNNIASTATERLARGKALQEGLREDTPEFEARYVELLDEATRKPEQSERLGTSDEREAARIVEAEGLTPGTQKYDDRFNEVFGSIVARDRQTAKQKESVSADKAIESIAEKAGGEDAFFELDLSKPRLRRKYERDIEKLERFGGLELSAADKKELGYVNELIALGAPGGRISDRETGILDKVLLDTRKYLTDDVAGIDTTSAYSAFRNTLRHALFGSVLTDGEIKSFNEQFGTLSQQTGPVLAQFRTALEQVRTRLEGLVNTNNSYVMKFRTGKSQDELNEVIDALDQRIDAFSNFTAVEPPKMDEERRKKLEAILSGANDED